MGTGVNFLKSGTANGSLGDPGRGFESVKNNLVRDHGALNIMIGIKYYILSFHYFVRVQVNILQVLSFLIIFLWTPFLISS